MFKVLFHAMLTVKNDTYLPSTTAIGFNGIVTCIGDFMRGDEVMTAEGHIPTQRRLAGGHECTYSKEKQLYMHRWRVCVNSSPFRPHFFACSIDGGDNA
jgi:hypothetical protein